MRSHLVLVVIAALGLAACSHSLQSAQHPSCLPPRALGAPAGIGIIGMSLDQRANETGAPELFVDRVVPDGPAATAGIRPGDRLLSIEGISTQGMSIGEAARRLRGPTDASIALLVATDRRSRDVTITRVAPSKLWSGGATPPATAQGSERVRASDVAPAAQVTTPPCRH
jgi:membrane-associated protease RseP (regulator of RpoE activity)